MDVSFQLPTGHGIDVAALAAAAERRGYAAVWAGESWGDDAFVALATAAAATETVGLGTAIANVFSRSPATLAMAAASLDRVSDGRARLGVGVSTPALIEGVHGMAYDRPLRRTHEAVELVKRLTGGDGRVTYDGEVFSVTGVPALDVDVPVFNAALGPANRRLTGRVCDGWIPHLVPFPDLDEAFATVADAARAADRDPDTVTVAPYVPAAVSRDAAEARSALRSHVAYYVGSGEGYRTAVAARFPDEAALIAERWRAGDRAAARRAVSDAMVDVLGVAGTPDEARDRFDDLASSDIVDEAIVVLAGEPGDERRRLALDAFAP